MDTILTLLSKKTISRSIIILKFKPSKRIRFKAGQYLDLLIPSNKAIVKKPFSIASDPSQKDIELIIKIVQNGQASNFFKKIKLGETIKTNKPSGSFLIPYTKKKTNLVFFSSGAGISPIRSMIYSALKNKKILTINLYLTQKNKREFILKDELTSLANKNNRFIFKYSSNLLKTMDKITNNNNEFYICGSPSFVSKTSEMLIKKNVPKQQIHFEKY